MPDLDRVVFRDFDGTLARRHDLWSGALVDAWWSVKQSADVSVADLRPYLGAGFPWHDSTVIRQPQSADEWWAALRSVLVGAHAIRSARITNTDDIWMVGDNPVADVDGARNAGIRAILADGSYRVSVGMTVLRAARLISNHRARNAR
ncbi:MAG TPA: HAD hydrolase-like protein [Leifsonia sp.]|nr:HAD hydrolase-like protein [Leifsonia sp.]